LCPACALGFAWADGDGGEPATSLHHTNVLRVLRRSILGLRSPPEAPLSSGDLSVNGHPADKPWKAVAASCGVFHVGVSHDVRPISLTLPAIPRAGTGNRRGAGGHLTYHR